MERRFDGTFAECKEQQLVFLLVRQLATAQFEVANATLTRRLWDEVNALDIDPERITRLLYGGQDVTDREALQRLDEQWRAEHRPTQRQGWFRRPGGAWRQSAPPTASPAHLAVG